jgi:hypothetical protein
MTVGAMIAAAAVAQAASAGQLKAGAGKVSITPTADEFPYVVPHEKTVVGVHDDLFARALVLDDGAKRAVIVSLEVTAVPKPEEVVKAVAAAAHVSPGDVLVTATHTHNVLLAFYHGELTNPSQTVEMQRVEDGAVAAVKQAIAQLRPARIAWARGQAFVNTNNGEETGRKGWYDPTASSDKALDVVRVQDMAGKPLAAVLDYASHSEVMFRSVSKDGGYEVTGDLPGATMRILEAQPGAAPVVLYLTGAEGDQLPLFKSLQPDAELPGADQGAGGWALLDAQARGLASAALDTMATMPAGDASVRIATAQGAATCPGQHYDVERPSGKILGVKDTAPVVIPLTTIRINDFAFAAAGADLASDIGRSIKAGSPVAHTTVVTMQAGSVGYVLNDAAYVHPGHGALGSPIKPGCATAALSSGIAGLLAKSDR